MQHHTHAAALTATHMCAHTMLPNGATAAGTAAPPPPILTQLNMPPTTNTHNLTNTTTTHQHQRMPQYQPHQTSIQMQKIRQQHQHINYNNNHSNNHINKNGNYNHYNNNNNNNNINLKTSLHNQSATQQQQQQVIGRNVAIQQTHQTVPAQQQTTHMGHIKGVNHNNNNQNIATTAPINYTQKAHYNHMGTKIKYNNNNVALNNNNNNNYYYKNTANAFNKNSFSFGSPKYMPAHNYRYNGKTAQRAATNGGTTASNVHKITANRNNITVIPDSNHTENEAETTESNRKQKDIEINAECNNELDNKTETGDIEENSSDKIVTYDAADKSISSASSSSKDAENNNNNNNNNNILSNEDEEGATKQGKDKTPMCLVNELARFNKITHQYRLTSEKGPAHCKRFTVTLKLGDEEYSAEGFKIKKAQHMAAAQAIEQTKYTHPVPKTMRRNEEGNFNRSNITPTVALNALAMKLGQQTYYLFDPRQMPHAVPPPPPHANMDAGHDASLHAAPFASHPHAMLPHPHAAYMRRTGAAYPPMPMLPHFQARFGSVRGYMPKFTPRFTAQPATAHSNVGPPPLPLPPHAYHAAQMYERDVISMGPCKITLIVGKQKFVGTGRTLQQAKHDAAAQALQVLKTQQAEQMQEEEAFSSNRDETDDKKSPISLVHEIGIKRDMPVRFKVLREEGPAHMRKFITACIVGSIITEGEGNGKKISKKRSAEKMLEELRKLPPLTPTKSPTRRIKMKTPGKMSLGAVAGTPKSEKRKRVNMRESKDKSVLDASLLDEDNPVTKLMQIQQLRKEKEPVFELVAKSGNEHSRRKEFIIEVTFQNLVARGVAVNKRLAKRTAAQNMLSLLSEVDAAKAAEQNKSINVIISEPAVEVVNTAEPVTAGQETAESAQENNQTKPTAATTTTIAKDVYNVPMVETTAGQVPGILILRPNKKSNTKKKPTTLNTSPTLSNNCVEDQTIKTTSSTVVATTTITKILANNKEITKTKTNATATSVDTTDNNAENATDETTTVVAENSDAKTVECNTAATNSSSSTNKSNSANLIMKEQLLYLGKLMGFEVCFNDYPKGGSHNDFLTIVTLSTDPPQICHGTGNTCDESQNDAARNALKILSELGLNSAKK